MRVCIFLIKNQTVFISFKIIRPKVDLINLYGKRQFTIWI